MVTSRHQVSSAILSLVLILGAPSAVAQKFFPDDPLEKELEPLDTDDPQYRSLSAVLEYLSNQFTKPGERHPEGAVIPARGVNTLGEVLDGAWFTNRHARKRLLPDELRSGPGSAFPPSISQPWEVLVVKEFGYRPGILIRDHADRVYLLRFDPKDHLEMSTGAEVISSRLIHALGYHTVEDYLVYFDRDQLRATPEGANITSMGKPRDLEEEDISDFLEGVGRDPEKGYRAVASRVPDGVPLGPFQYYTTRSDDPNDLFPHEHLRALRGYYVFASWLNFTYAGAPTTLDILVTEDFGGRKIRHIRHYVIDFFASLGSDVQRQKEVREGNDPLFSMEATARNFGQFGIYTPKWMRAYYPKDPAVGRFEGEAFDPARWYTTGKNAAFENRLPDDEFWAAKILMSLTDEDIRTVVEEGEYSRQEVTDWIANSLIQRRDKIGRYYFSKVLPLDDFRVENGELRFVDLDVKYGFNSPQEIHVAWSTFDNLRQTSQQILGTRGTQAPQQVLSSQEGTYFVATLTDEEDDEPLEVYLRRESSGLKVVGLDRKWPGKILADPAPRPQSQARSRYQELQEFEKKLFESYTQAYNRDTGLSLDPIEYWSSLSVSERTTFTAVTNALGQTELTDEAGNSLGKVIDRVVKLERIAGQYYGRGGDEQYRLFFEVKPGTREILEKSTTFYRDADNTVYHPGYPLNFRQVGKPPTMQISMAEEGTRVDIDIDYRSSKMPKAMFNGHLTSANSDVRAGNNYDLHSQRWNGLDAWWQGLYGDVKRRDSAVLDLLAWSARPEYVDLPPDRPFGASPEKIEDAAQEFLADWLLRAKFREALQFMSPQVAGCIGRRSQEDVQVDSLEQGVTVLLNQFNEINVALDHRENLAAAIHGLEPWRLNRFTILDHPFRQLFSVFTVPDDIAAQYLCEPRPTLKTIVAEARAKNAPGSYHATMFRFRFGDLGGTLALIWARVDGAWKIVAWDSVEQ